MKESAQSLVFPQGPKPLVPGATVVLLGFSAVMGQIVLMRELLVVFSGNEIGLGIVLACWLLWTALGSFVAGRLPSRLGGAKTVGVVESLAGLSLLAAICFTRSSRAIFHILPGEIAGPLAMALTALTGLSLFCILSGGLFVFTVRLYGRSRAAATRVATGAAYLLESAGSALGGLLASLVLLRYCNALQMALLVALLNFCLASQLVFRKPSGRIVGLCCALLLSLLIAAALPRLQSATLAGLWNGQHLLDTRDSIYGNLAVTENGGLHSVYENGSIVANAPDLNAAEEAAHFALLEHAAPRRVLLLGEGFNGSLAEALKHPTVERVDYVELDPALIAMTRRLLPTETAAYSDPRVRLHLADGRHFLATSHETYDVIILNVPEPQSAQLNRFYTVEFFRMARRRLAPGGLLALQLRASEDYISPALAEFLGCIRHTLRQVFPVVVAIPGETVHFFAAEQPGALTSDPAVLVQRLRERKVETLYVREYFLPFRMSPERVADLDQQLQATAVTPVNRDLAPVAYYFDVALWGSQFNSDAARWFRAAARIRYSLVCVVALVLCVTVCAAFGLRRSAVSRARAAAAACVTAAGLTMMGLQIFVLLLFQSAFGYLYQQLAVLIAMFMAGIAFGSWMSLRRLARRRSSHALRALWLTQLAVALAAPAVLLCAHLLMRTSSALGWQMAAEVAFPALAALSGMLGGFQFPLAAALYLGDNDRASPGALYALDLLGGCLGAVLLSGYLIPVFGFWRCAWLIALVNLAPAALAAAARSSPAPSTPSG